jgi:hypothetical protein
VWQLAQFVLKMAAPFVPTFVGEPAGPPVPATEAT